MSGKSVLTENTVRKSAKLISHLEDGELAGATYAPCGRATDAGEHVEKIR